jgi:hypothetical protein
VGDDAEYQMELDSEADSQAELERQSAEAEPCRPLLCWDDGELGYIWDWEPATRVYGIFSDLHDYENVGTMSFLSIGVPSELDVPDELGSFRAESSDAATHEVIVLTRNDIDPLVDVASKMRDGVPTLKEEMIAGMFEAMVLFMEAEPERGMFLFARTL